MYKASLDNLYTTIMLRLEIVSHFAALTKATGGGLTPVTLTAVQHRLTMTLTSLLSQNFVLRIYVLFLQIFLD